MAQPRKIHDRFFKQAKEEGFAARSAYKLKEIQERRRIIRKGDRVLDLGCAPGSWVQVASELVGPGGRVVGIDLKPVTIGQTAHDNCKTLVADAFRTDSVALLGLLNDSGNTQRFDVVLSDMAPNTEGGAGGTTDHFRSVDLCRRVLELVASVLKTGGHCVMKVFEGEAYPALLKETGRMFEEVKGLKPQASRDVSREMFVIAMRFKGNDARSVPPPRSADQPTPALPKPGDGWGGGSRPEPER